MEKINKITILGAGLAGLSTSFHLGHENCVIFEAKPYYGGLIYSDFCNGFTWDMGPHISFTRNEYVRNLLAESVNQEFEEYDVHISNFFKGHWIDHPAQCNFYQIPEPLRTKCLDSFLYYRSQETQQTNLSNYKDWLYHAFGPVFADAFPTAYTRKYWTTDPINLGVDWIGPRVYYPNIEDIKNGFKGPLGHNTYYVTKVRYPSRGGFISFARKLADGAQIIYNKTLQTINFRNRKLGFSDGTQTRYDVLVSTIPLPILIMCSEDAPAEIREAASILRCTSLFLVNIAASHERKRNNHWIYVYDEDKLSTRISFTEGFSPNNAPDETTGIQVEVYESAYKPLLIDHRDIASRVQLELIEMGLLESREAVISVHVRYIPWANVIFDHNRQSALGKINSFLDSIDVIRAGRFAEWKYLWTDDSLLSGQRAAEQCLNQLYT